MDSQDKNKKFKTPDNEDYDINNPQNLTQPAFNSGADGGQNTTSPPVENLNQQNDENNQLGDATATKSHDNSTLNDEPLHGNDQKTDLGNGKNREDKEDEKLIRK